ncbi:MAG: hypothetical protein ABSA33_01895 [Candidatus Micrarchaeaceae archaeon]
MALEFVDTIDRPLAGYLSSTLAKQRQGRHILKHILFEANLGERTLLVADKDGLPGNFLEHATLHP